MWYDHFIELELHHGLDINNENHIWLLHHLFLPVINSHLAFWAESWNMHQITMRGQPNCSLDDMFGFDMLELEVFGVDWEELDDDDLLRSLCQNYAHDGATSWIGRCGPPPTVNEVPVDPPALGSSTDHLVAQLTERLAHIHHGPERENVLMLWSQGLAVARVCLPELF
ncbi:hypothetical protein Moror_4307 [Moniliophthora roreri MCA 2997]|uniref:Integrase core domain-containing protein n=1 Tax=Moniliophthora roreri (strain MCA 2997) TaxID=1381753 RepID=V2XMU7_MONRO|nr:hypothetical protein Moror_4307 [Moniliophthora roreri MCA 2997]